MRTLTMLFFVCAMACHAAQGWADDTPMRYRVDYVQESHLRSNGAVLHFVSLDLEWPSWINADRPPVLLHHISSLLFGKPTLRLQEGMTAFLDSLGQEVNTVPDDTALLKVYHTLELRLVAYSPMRYISFRVIAANRNAQDAFPASPTHHIFTYDLVNNKILGMKDLLKRGCFPDNAYYFPFMYALRQHTPKDSWVDEVFEYLDFPDEACLMYDGLVCDMGFYRDEDRTSHTLSFLPYLTVCQFYNKKVERLLDTNAPEMPIPPDPKRVGRGELEADTLAVYDVVDQEPVFGDETHSLKAFMASNLQYPELEDLLQLSGKTVMQFVVERDGSVSNVSVVATATSGFDRESVRVVKMMPRWKPGTVNGQPVRTKVTLPVIWKKVSE